MAWKCSYNLMKTFANLISWTTRSSSKLWAAVILLCSLIVNRKFILMARKCGYDLMKTFANPINWNHSFFVITVSGGNFTLFTDCQSKVYFDGSKMWLRSDEDIRESDQLNHSFFVKTVSSGNFTSIVSVNRKFILIE